MSEGEASGARPAGWALDPFGFGEAWAHALGIRGPLSGDVTQAIRAALIDHLGQIGLINLNVGRSGDAELEGRIVAEVASYGRQLGWIVEALGALVRAERGEPARDADAGALDRVGELRAQVEAVKIRTAAERVDRLVADIRELRADPRANADALRSLRAALDGD
jgi:hypothetical protein